MKKHCHKITCVHEAELESVVADYKEQGYTLHKILPTDDIEFWLEDGYWDVYFEKEVSA